jgi:hypothetical protein
MSIKISDLPAAVAVNNSDIFPIVQDGTTKKATASLIRPETTGTGLTVLQTSPSISAPFINGYIEASSNISAGASTTLDISASTVLIVTLANATATTFTMPPAAAGKSFTVYLKQPASGAVGSATFTGVKFPNAGSFAVTALNERLDILAFVSDGVNWYCSFVQNFVY